MRVLARLFAVAASVGIVLVAGAPSALAGGPTSVLIVSPATGQTASLYTTDTDYDRLLRALGETVTAAAGAPDLHGGPGTSAVNVTWLVHDVQVWRVDSVFTDTDGGPWVETLASYDRIDFGAQGVLHRPADPDQLNELLAGLGVLSPGQMASATAEVPATAGQPALAPVRRSAASRDTGGDEWVWLLVGLAGGAVLAAGARPVVALVRPGGRRSPRSG